MAEQNGTKTVEKYIAEQSARFEAAFAELGKLQANGIARIGDYVETANRVAHDQIAFADQLASEWRKLVLAATKSAAEMFVPKA